MTAKAFSLLPSLGLNGHNKQKCFFFFMYTKKREISEKFDYYFPSNKDLHFLSGQGFCPPPLTDMSAKNVIFFERLPLTY